MSHTWLRAAGLMVVLLGLSGCNQSVDDQISNGLQLTETVFAEELQSIQIKLGM